MQINEVVGQVPQGVRLPLVDQPPESGRPTAEARPGRSGAEASRPLAGRGPKDAGPAQSPPRYGAGF
jgi:hypothetical protein